jgi:homoserine kinase
MSDSLSIRVPATSANLGPGFDTLGLALSFYNTVTIREATADGNRVLVSGEGADVLSTDSSNIAYASAQLLFRTVEAPTCNFQLEMHNQIPLSRGLGSSSAAYLGGLMAANEWARRHGWQTASPQQILTLATQLEGHPDNAAACLYGGLVVSVENEGRAFAVKMPVAQWPHFAVWIPDEPLPTKQARAVVPTEVSRADAVFNISRTGLLLAALSVGDFEALSEAFARSPASNAASAADSRLPRNQASGDGSGRNRRHTSRCR